MYVCVYIYIYIYKHIYIYESSKLKGHLNSIDFHSECQRESCPFQVGNPVTEKSTMRSQWKLCWVVPQVVFREEYVEDGTWRPNR